MATIGYGAIQLNTPGTNRTIDVFSAPTHGGTTLIAGDIGIINAGTVDKAAANQAANILGVCLHGSLEVFATANASVTIATLFGANTIGTGLEPSEPTNMHVALFHHGQSIEISLSTATTPGAQPPGTQVGLGYDGTSGLFFADPSASNKVATIESYVFGPGQGGSGDSGGRCNIVFNIAGALAF